MLLCDNEGGPTGAVRRGLGCGDPSACTTVLLGGDKLKDKRSLKIITYTQYIGVLITDKYVSNKTREITFVEASKVVVVIQANSSNVELTLKINIVYVLKIMYVHIHKST